MKTRLLDEFVAVSGDHRKHALRLLNGAGDGERQRQPKRIYDEAVRQALVVLWEASSWATS